MRRREDSEMYCGRKDSGEGQILRMNGKEERCVEFGGMCGNEDLVGRFKSE
jgi:hypothetical protein